MAEPFVLHMNPSSAPTATNPAGSSSLILSDLEGQQFVLQIGQSSTPGPPPPPPPPPPPSSHDQQTKLSTTPPPHGTLNLKVTEPILLHINSLTPLLNQNYQVPSSSSPPPVQKQDQPQSDPPPPSAGDIGTGTIPSKKGVLSRVGSLANLLPTGTVLAFQAIIPSLSYNGRCQVFNKYLGVCVIVVCSIICFLSSFTDSHKHENKVYYGIATFKSLLVFNYKDRDSEEKKIEGELKKKRITGKDFVHAFGSVFVFLIFACSSSEVQNCYFPKSRQVLEYSLVMYMPLVVGILSSFLFTYFPTERKGIGYTCS